MRASSGHGSRRTVYSIHAMTRSPEPRRQHPYRASGAASLGHLRRIGIGRLQLVRSMKSGSEYGSARTGSASLRCRSKPLAGAYRF